MNKFLQPIKDFFGSKNELVESTEVALEERLTSPFYGYFITSWIFWNWRILYIAFFVSQDNILKKTGLLRYDYLKGAFPVLGTWYFWLHFIIFPLLTTYLFFWIFPFITRIFLKKYIKNKIKNKIIEAEESKNISKAEKDKIKAEKELIVAESNKAKEVRRVEKETPEILWKNEFENLKKSSRFINLFEQISDSIYQHGGSIKNEYGVFILQKDNLAYADVNDLISMVGSSIKLTEKGRYFLRLYNQQKG